MASSAAETYRVCGVAALYAALLGIAVGAPDQARAQAAIRVLDVVGVARSEAHIDISIQFNCHVRYVSHSPQDGETVHVRLTLDRDCGGARSESLPPPADEELMRSIELNPLVANDVDLTIAWLQKETFAVAPSVDQTGLRIRLLRPDKRAARVFINESTQPVVSGYAINLESAQSDFDAGAVARAQSALQTHAYVSGVVVDGVQWYRLRIGPFVSRERAERKLLEAQAQYPRAWLAIADEAEPGPAAPEEGEETAAATPNQDNRGVQPSERVDAAQADALFRSAQADMRHKNYNGAIESLTKLLRGIPSGQRPEARELLGLARERNSQLAHAKAEYQAYLRDFPDNREAERVRKRLHALRTARRQSRSGGLFGNNDDDPQAWRLYGGIAQMYRRDTNQIDSTSQLATGAASSAENRFASQNALLNDFDLVARKRGFQYDAIGRISAGYIKDLLADGPGDQVRVSSAYFELTDREHGWSGRFGRQNRSSSGLLGTFDGLVASYELHRHLTIDTAFGYPVESSRNGVMTDRRFESLALDFGTFGTAWEPSIYYVNQTFQGLVDRQALGVELHYFQPGRVLVGFADYDLHFQELNSVVLIGTVLLPAQWTVNVDLERRKSPLLTTRNALIGQPVNNFGALLDAFSEDEVRQFALDRTVDAQVYGVSISRPLGQRWQFMLNAASFDSSAMPPSGGVEGIPDPGSETMVSMQLLALSLFRGNDVNAIGLRYQTGGSADVSSIGVNSRLPLWGSWRLGPQLRADRRVFQSDGSTQWIYAPALRVDLALTRLWFELELGAELASRESPTLSEDTKRYYGSISWRFNF